MAAEVASLFMKLDVDTLSFVSKFQNAEKVTDRAAREIRSSLNKIDGSALSLNKRFTTLSSAMKPFEAHAISTSARLGSLGTAVTNLGAGIKGLAAIGGLGWGISSLKELGDTATRISNSLKVAGLDGGEMVRVYNSLFESAQRYAVPLESLATLYGQISLSQRELGISTDSLLRFTDKISLALTVAGTNAQTASGALLQLSQAMGSGVVRSQEFNSILSGVPTIAQAAAAGIAEAGGSVGKLRELVNDGKVSSRAFFEGFLAGSVQLESKAASAATTVAGAFTRLNNALIDTAGKLDAVLGASARTVETIGKISAVIEVVGSNAGKAAGVFETFATALHGTEKHAEGVYGWLAKIAALNPTNNLSKFIVDKVSSIDRTSPALPQSGIGEWGGVPDAAANVPLPQSRPQSTAAVKPISLADYPVAAEKNAKAANAERDAFERAAFAVEKRTAMLRADIAAVGESEAVRERARVVAQLETAAIAANKAAGKSNTSVTAEQRDKINELADAFGNARAQIEQANGPLAAFARQAADVNKQLESAVLEGLRGFEDSLISIADGSKSTKDAFHDMAEAILKDIARLMIRQNITGPIASLLAGGGGLGGGGGGLLGSLFGGGTGFMHSPGAFSGAFPQPLFSAKGNVFGPSGHLTAFAKGGIVSSPTLFPFAKGTGLMGEAGPEAILPLSRGAGGKLGVQAAGFGGRGNEVHIHNYGAKVEQRRSKTEDGGERLDITVMVEDIIAGGIASRQGRAFEAVKNTFGLDPTRGLA